MRQLGRLCPRCGGATHGRPWARARTGAPVFVSLAYADGLGLVGWSRDAAIGVDLERDDGVSRAGDYGDLATWVRDEAVLKATGEGLARDPATLRGDEAWTASLAVADGYVGAVALVAPGGTTAGPPSFTWRTAGPGAVRAAARR